MSLADYIRTLEARLGGDRLFWFGTRATDATSLLVLEQFAGVFSLISPLRVSARSEFVESCLELYSGERPDLNAYAIDSDRSEAARRLRRDLAHAWRSGTYVAPYRPSDFLSATYFPRIETSGYLGMFHGQQAAFEHKPWVEISLRGRGVRTIGWHYFADDDIDLIDEAVYDGPRVLRANHSDGGIGVVLLQAKESAHDFLPKHDDLFVAVAPYLDPNVPLNVGGCVFPNGAITVHSPSVQLIGLGKCTSRRFGYCGNDFARIGELLSDQQVRNLETMVRNIGGWLHSEGYRGAFGVDALLYRDELHLTEVNPRFQGSTEASTTLDREFGIADIILDHVAAFLGLDAPDNGPSMLEVVRAQMTRPRRLSHVVCYNTAGPRRPKSGLAVPDDEEFQILSVPDESVVVGDEAMLFKLAWPDSVTPDGFGLIDTVADTVDEYAKRLFEKARG